jgi:hypothetical protein
MRALALLTVLLLAGFLMTSHLQVPFANSMHGHNNAWYGLAARNYGRYGVVALRGAMCLQAGAPVADPRLYLHHPPLVALLVRASFLAFGEGEWQTRIVPLVLSLVAVALWFALLVEVFPARPLVATIGALLAASTPLWAYYATMADPQGAGVLCALAGALLFCARWQRTHARSDLLGAQAFLLFGYLCDWPTFLAAGLMALWLWRAGGSGRAAIAVLAPAALIGTALIAWAMLYRGRGVPFGEAFASRALLAPGQSLGDALAAVGRHHLAGFCLPLALAGWIGAAAATLALVRGRLAPREALLLVPLATGVIYVLAFLPGAAIHDYWQIYLAPGLALPVCLVLDLGLAHPRARRWALGLAVGAVVIACVHGYRVSRERWRDENVPELQMKDVGREVAALTQPSERVATTLDPNLPLLFYSDRHFLFGVASLAQLMPQREAIRDLGAWLTRDRGESTAERAAGPYLQGPTRVGGYRIWAIRHP